MKIKKAALVIYTVLLAFSLTVFTTACSSAPANTPAGDNSTSQASTAATSGASTNDSGNEASEDADKPVTLSFAHYWPEPLEVGLRAVTDDYISKHPNVSVEYKLVEFGEFVTKFLVDAAAGTANDIYLVEQGWCGTIFDSGMVEPLEQHINASPEEWDLDRFFPGMLDSTCKYNGVLLAIPHIVERDCVAINMDILDAAGVDAPDYTWTWDDLIDIARRIHDPDNGIYGFKSSLWSIMRDETSRRDIPWVVDGKSNFLSDDVKELAYWVDSTIRPLLPPVDMEQPFLTGKLGMMHYGICQILSMDTDFEWIVRPLPNLNGKDIGMSIANNLVIYNGSKNKDAAIDLLKTLVSDDGYLLYSHNGIQGTFGASGKALDLVLTPIDGAPYDTIKETFLHSETVTSYPVSKYALVVSSEFGRDGDSVMSGELSIDEFLINLDAAVNESLDS